MSFGIASVMRLNTTTGSNPIAIVIAKNSTTSTRRCARSMLDMND